MKSNLLKREIEFLSTEDLNIHYCFILDRAQKLEAKDIPIADAREVLWIEDILHSRLIKQLGRDPYPPDRIEEEYPSNYMISLVKSRQKKTEIKAEEKLSFKITIISSIGSIVKTQNVKVGSRSDAAIKAQAMIDERGLKKATYKIS